MSRLILPAAHFWLVPQLIDPLQKTQRIDESLEGLEGTKAIADDILIWGDGNTIEEATSNHNARLSALLERCQQKHT